MQLLFEKKGRAALTAYVSYAVFEAPKQGPYVETYLSIIGSSLKMIKNNDGTYQGAAEIAICFIQKDEIKSAKKYIVTGPLTKDTNHVANFIDQQRFPLPAGDYIMEVTISDRNNRNDLFTEKVPVQIQLELSKITISDIQLLESFTKSIHPETLTKSGYDLVPYVSSFYPENLNKLKFYAEVYRANQFVQEADRIVICYFIESYEKRIKNANCAAFTKTEAKEVNAVMGEFNMDNLATGNYNLVIEVRNKENKLLADKRCFFQRQNKSIPLSEETLKNSDITASFVNNYKNPDTLKEHIRSLRPISIASEIQFAENQLKDSNLKEMQQYFYNFWLSRNSTDPQMAWKEYHTEVLKVNKEFSTHNLKGYDTDRGRVYLQYGPPDSRNVVNTEPSAYPYEIWQYNSLVNKSLLLTNAFNRQSNRRFVFYNPDLVSNKYILIHSDARGEVLNTRWQTMLHKRTVPSSNLDEEKVKDNYGGNVNDNYSNPK